MSAMAELAHDVANVRIHLGANNPPEPTPYEGVRVHIEDLQVEAQNWLDGSTVGNEQEAQAIAALLDDLRKAGKAADEARKLEAKPFDDGKAEVQARYKPLLSSVETAVDACKKALATWLAKLEAEKRAQAEAARREADAKVQAAADAAKAAAANDLTARLAAETLANEALAAQKAATKAEKDRANVKGGARAATLRTSYRPVMTDRREALEHYWQIRRADIEEVLMGFAREDASCGKRQIPGFEVIEERTVV